MSRINQEVGKLEIFTIKVKDSEFCFSFYFILFYFFILFVFLFLNLGLKYSMMLYMTITNFHALVIYFTIIVIQLYITY